jgi:aspirochlorine biosynthesis cytochrome P450 monooxygenase
VIWNCLPLGRLRNWWYWLASFKVRQDVRYASECLIPTLQERMALRDSGAVEKDKPADVLQFAVDQPIPSTRENDARRHSIRVIQLTFASTGTIITLLYRLMYLILLFPEYLEPLRNEIAEVLPRDGAFGDVKTLNSLTLLDSFIRETMRFYPAACFFGQRTAREEVVLEDLRLEPKSRIAFPAAGTNMDPENHKDALTFDGFRFAGSEYSPRSEGRINASTADSKFPSYVCMLDSTVRAQLTRSERWGFGNQACPGRFYAVRLVKLIFGRLLHEYEFDWASSAAENTREMPKGMCIEGMFLPDIKSRIRIKSRYSE